MKVVLLGLLLTTVWCYIELPIIRVPHGTKTIDLPDNWTCPKEQPSADYTQLCFMRDISHNIQLYNNDQLYMMSMDMSIPISWIKSPHCHVAGGSNSCSRLDKSIKEEIRNKIRTVKNKIKQRFRKEHQEPSSSYTSIGIVDKITGELERGKNVLFWTKDSDKLTSLYKLFLIGLFLTDQKDRMSLNSTNFINASEITQHANSLSDGAISLRFDDQSQNSFLNQIFAYVGSNDKIITVYLGENSTVTIGDLSVKNAEKGYSGIDWVNLDQKKYPLVDQITVQLVDTEKTSSFESGSEAIFTLSASYISLPQKQIDSLIKQLDAVAKCKVGHNSFLECKISNQKPWHKRRLTFELGQIKMSFSAQELQKSTKGKDATLLIRQSESDYIIFGQPVFKRYFVVLDYHLNRIGIADRRTTFQERFFEVVTLVRLLTFVFMSGCLFILCYKPVFNLVETVRLYYRINDYSKNPSQTKRLKYSSIQQPNPYEDLNKRVRDSLDEPVVQGI